MKSIKVLLSIFAGGMLLLASSCTKINGEGPVVSEQRTTTNFSRLHFGTGGTLHYEPSAVTSVDIRAQQNILNVIETYVTDDELKIKIKDNTVIHSHEPIQVFVKAPALRGIYINGSGNVITEKDISNAALKLETNGSGRFDLSEVHTGTLEARVNGSGDILIRNGSAQQASLKISGSGDINLLGMKADSAYTQTSGSGTIGLWVTEYLESNISGSGHVNYKGSPLVKVNISGSGRVRPY